MRIFRYIYWILLPLVLLCGCAKDLPDGPKPEEVTDIIPFSITVQSEPTTRASFSGESLGEGEYVFADGDKLYIIGGEGNIYGALTLASGAGTGTATFSGSLTIINDYTPTAETMLSATLVGSQQGDFFTISGEKITDGPFYPASIAYSDLANLVQKYSHFTATFPYSLRRVTLTQQTAFLNFSLELYHSDLSGSPSTVQVDIKSSDGTLLHSVTDIPVGGTTAISKIQFSTVFPADNNLQGAQTWIENGEEDIHLSPDFSNSLELLPNKYYRVVRSAVEDFTVEAPSNGTGANVTFNYTPVQYRTYNNNDGWSEWTSYEGTISLSAGEKVTFRGQRTSYANTGGSTPLITVTNSVYIYGDLMSLSCDENWDRRISVGSQAFMQAFKDCSNVNIPSDKELILSAVTLGTSCYKGMFMNCSNLLKAPILPATTAPESCYESMFQDCTNMTTPPPSLPATWLGFKAYYKMFYNCQKLEQIPEFPHEPGEEYTLTPGTSAENQKQNGVCYQMFYKCDALTTLENRQLFNSDTQLVLGCFNDMFSTCANLTTVPYDFLPSTHLGASCYRGMFQSCKNLTRAPDLPAETLVERCYQYMFNTCTSLIYLRCYATNPSSAYSQNWLANAKNTEDCYFYRKGTTAWTRDGNGIPSNWQIVDE